MAQGASEQLHLCCPYELELERFAIEVVGHHVGNIRRLEVREYLVHAKAVSPVMTSACRKSCTYGASIILV